MNAWRSTWLDWTPTLPPATPVFLGPHTADEPSKPPKGPEHDPPKTFEGFEGAPPVHSEKITDLLADALDAALEREAIAIEDGEQTPAEAERLALRSAGRVLKQPWESTADLPPQGVAILALMRHQRDCLVCARRPGACPEGSDIVNRWNHAREAAR